MIGRAGRPAARRNATRAARAAGRNRTGPAEAAGRDRNRCVGAAGAFIALLLSAAPALGQGSAATPPVQPGALANGSVLLTPADGRQAATREPAVTSPDASRPAGSIGRFLAGGAIAFAAHEGGHVLFGRLFGTKTGLRRVSFARIPFFAITHTGTLTPRRQFVVSSAGFWTQHATSEVLLTLRPRLRDENSPLLDGVIAFDVLASVAYAGTAFARFGPSERDTRSMAATLGVNERWVGLLVLLPAVLDAYRYFDPEAGWASWASRGVKVGGVLLVIR